MSDLTEWNKIFEALKSLNSFLIIEENNKELISENISSDKINNIVKQYKTNSAGKQQYKRNV